MSNLIDPTEARALPDLSVTLVQTRLHWEDAAGNCRALSSMLQHHSDADVVILPEVFNSGFSMNVAATAQRMDGPTISWMRETANRLQTALCGSLAIKVDNHVFNRFVMALPDGQLLHYDKRHLFRMGGEHQRYAPGQKRCIWQWRGWRICPMVCYDLRFPVWSRNHDDFDALIYVANWPTERRSHWRALLTARAIENQCAVIGVNRIGEDRHGIRYSGDSLVVDAQGQRLSDPGDTEGVHRCRINGREQSRYRSRFPTVLDADRFALSDQPRDGNNHGQ